MKKRRFSDKQRVSHLKAKTDDAIRNSIRQIDQANARDSLDGSIPDNPGTEFFEVVQSISIIVI